MAYLVLGLVLMFFVIVVAFVVWRVNAGEMESGGSMGHQLFGRDKDDWGPKP